MRPRDEPSVIAAAAELIARLGRLDSELAARISPGLRRGQRVHRADPLGRDLQPVSSGGVARGNKALAARVTTTTPSRLIFERGWRSSPRTRGPTISCDWMMIRDAFALDTGSVAGDGVSGMLPLEHRARRCRKAPSRSSTTATASGRWQEFRRSHTDRAPAASTPSRSGSRSTTWSESPSCMRRRLAFCHSHVRRPVSVPEAMSSQRELT